MSGHSFVSVYLLSPSISLATGHSQRATGIVFYRRFRDNLLFFVAPSRRGLEGSQAVIQLPAMQRRCQGGFSGNCRVHGHSVFC